MRPWELDPGAGDARQVGPLPANALWIGISRTGELFSVGGASELYRIDTCTFEPTLVERIPFALGLAGDTDSDDLFLAGPPLRRIDTTTFAVADVGGERGAGGPPRWCGFVEDLARAPVDERLFAVMTACAACPGVDRMLVELDPATGDALANVGCMDWQVRGLAFDDFGDLYGSITSAAGGILRIDPRTAEIEPVGIGGGYVVGRSLASFPCD